MTIAARRTGRMILEQTAQVQRALWARLNPSTRSLPTFVVGCNRSGTTMVTLQLGKSWQIRAFNENDPEAFAGYHLRDFQTILGILDQTGSPNALFKPVLDTYSAREFLDTFENARVIFVYRHYYDVINSLLKKAQQRGHVTKTEELQRWLKSDFDEFKLATLPRKSKDRLRSLWSDELNEESSAALFWLFQNHLFFDLGLANHPRAQLVQYERIVADPPVEFRRICQFIGIKYEGQMARGVHADSVAKKPLQQVTPRVRDNCLELLAQLNSCLPDRTVDESSHLISVFR